MLLLIPCIILGVLVSSAFCYSDSTLKNFAEEEDLEYIVLGGQDNVIVYDWGRLAGDSYIIAYNGQGLDNICITKKTENMNFEAEVEGDEQKIQYSCEAINDDAFNDISYPRAIEIVDRKDNNNVYLYILHKVNCGQEECNGAKISKIKYNKTDGEMSVERVTEIEGMSNKNNDNLVYSLTVDPDEELGFVTETTEEKSDTNSETLTSNVYFIDMNKGKHKAKVLSNGWADSNLTGTSNEVPMIYGTVLTQKYSVISFSPVNIGALYSFDKYYAVKSNENGVFRGKSLIDYSEKRVSGEKNSKTLCGSGRSFTSDQNDNIYFMHKLQSDVVNVTPSIKLWKGASCITLKEFDSVDSTYVSIIDRIHIADEKIMYLTTGETTDKNRYIQIKSLYVGANSYTSVKEHYDSVIDETIFMGAVFGTYFGALVVGLVVIGVRLFLAKRNR